MRAVWNEATLAETEKENVLFIEGNWYFPQESLTGGRFQESETVSKDDKGKVCFYHVSVDDQINPDAAWYYAELKQSAIDEIGKDFTGCVAFGRSVTVTE